MKKKRNRKQTAPPIILFIGIISILVVVSVMNLKEDSFMTPAKEHESNDSTLQLQESEDSIAENKVKNDEISTIENEVENPLQNLGDKLQIVEIGGYSGPYVEDGTDEPVSDVLMMRVLNTSNAAIEYAVIQLQLEDAAAEFTVSALMPGAEVILLERNRTPYDSTVDYTAAVVQLVNFAKYQYELDLHEDKIKIQVLNGAVNVTNISDEFIPEKVMIYYKNKEDGVFLGGIAYRITIEGGIAGGEIRQKMANHLSETNSEILFVNMVE